MVEYQPMIERLLYLYRLLPQLEKFNREISRLNNLLEAEPQGFKDVIECWRDTNIILGRLVGLKVKYKQGEEKTDNSEVQKTSHFVL